MNPTVLRTVLTDILAQCVAAYGQSGAPAAPARQFVTHGQPVVEGEQLTVWSGGLSATHPFPLAQLRAVKTTVVGSALVNIEVWRPCWPPAHVTTPSKTLPAPTKLQEAALDVADDAATLFGWISNLAAKGGLCPHLPGIATASDVSLGPMLPLGPQGLLVGWRWPMAVKLSVLPT